MTFETSAAASHKKEEILRRTFSGARWMLYLSASALAVGFCTNVMLGRVGPETLGFYSLLMLLVSMIQFFFVLGGPNVFVNYLPSLSLEQRPRFVFTYTVIVYVAGAFFLAVALLYPSIMHVVFRSELNVSVGTYLTVLVPILLAQALVWAMLQAELEGFSFAVSQNSVSWFYFAGVGMMALTGILGAGRRLDSVSGALNGYIFLAVVLANSIALMIGAFGLKKGHIGFHTLRQRWFLPDGFWKFTLALHFGTLFNFVIANAAPVFILRELGLRELGFFRAASVFAAFVIWVPGVFDKSFYPSFCNLVINKLPTDEVYGRFSRLNATASGLVALVILLFTRELLSVFGKEFGDEAYFLLSALSAGYLISTPFIQINFALVTAHLKTPHTMGAYALGAGAGIVLYAALVPKYGLAGIAAAFILLQLIMLFISVVLTRHFTRSPFPTRAFLTTLLATGMGLLGSHYFGALSWQNALIKSALFVLFFMLLIVAKLITKEEFREMLSVVIPQRVLGRVKR